MNLLYTVLEIKKHFKSNSDLHCNYVKWVSSQLNHAQLFQKLVQTNNKVDTNAPNHWPLLGEYNGDPRIFLRRGQ